MSTRQPKPIINLKDEHINTASFLICMFLFSVFTYTAIQVLQAYLRYQ